MGQDRWLLGVFILFSVTLTWGRLTQKFPGFPQGGKLTNGGKIWSVLVAGSSGYDNYRHQADVCHAYQILHKNGIPGENIIVMMVDDIARSPNNPTPNVLINRPNGPNVYKGVPIDYSGDDVKPENFIAVLTGNKDAISGIGSGKVIESGPKDHIFINFVGHGAPGFLGFPNDILTAKLLASTLQSMVYSNRFSKIALYVEACESGSMFDGILPDENSNIFVMTASDPRESSYACYYDESRRAFLGDLFSVNWMEDSEKGNLLIESLHQQFEVVRSNTNLSHVEEYGNLDIGSLSVAHFQGYRFESDSNAKESEEVPLTVDAVNNRDVPIEILKRQSESAVDEKSKRIFEYQTKRINRMRGHLDVTVSDIASEIAQGDHERVAYLLQSVSKLTYQTLDCYETVVQYFSRKCFKISKNPYTLSKMNVFINVCSVSWASAQSAIKAMDVICEKEGHLTGIV